jgi:hypothetical protein
MFEAFKAQDDVESELAKDPIEQQEEEEESKTGILGIY